MYLSKRAIDDFLNFKNHECKMGDTEPPQNGYNKEDFEKQEIQIQNHKNQMSKKIQNIQTGKYESHFGILKTQVQNQVSVIIHRSYLSLVNASSNDPIPLTSLFEDVNSTMILGNLEIFKNIIKSKKRIFKTVDDYAQVSLTGSHYTIFCEYLKMCPNITVIKQPEIENKMRKNPIQSRTKFETKFAEGNVSFVKVIGTMNLTSENVWSVLIKSRNKVFCLPLHKDVTEKENYKFKDADKVFISVNFQERNKNLSCIVFCVKPMNKEEKVGIQISKESFNAKTEESKRLPLLEKDERFVVHNLVAKVNSVKNSSLTIKQLHFFLKETAKFDNEEDKLVDIIRRQENMFNIDEENIVTSKEFDEKYFEDYLQMSHSILKETNKVQELPISNQLKITSKKSTVCISNMRGKLVKTDSSTPSVLFKVSETSNNIYSLQCKPTAFGTLLPNTDLDVMFRMNVNTSVKKRNVNFSIVDGKLDQKLTRSMENEARLVEINQKQDEDDTQDNTHNDLIVYSTIILLLSKPNNKKKKHPSLYALYNEHQQWFKDLVYKFKYDSVVKSSEMFTPINNTIVLQSTWLERFLYIGSNVTKFSEKLEDVDPVPISKKPLWAILGTKKEKELVVRDVFARVISMENKSKRALVRFGNNSDIIAIDCSKTEVDEGPNQPVTILINGSAVRKNKTVTIFVTKGKAGERKSMSKMKNNSSKEDNHKKKTFEFDDEFGMEFLDELSSPILSTGNPTIITVTDSEDENDDITDHDDITEEPKLEMDAKIQEKLPETDLLEHNKTRKGSCCIC